MAHAHYPSFMISEVIGGSFCTRMSSTHEIILRVATRTYIFHNHSRLQASRCWSAICRACGSENEDKDKGNEIAEELVTSVVRRKLTI